MSGSRIVEPAVQVWHALEATRVIETLASADTGLSAGEAGARLVKHGPNVLAEQHTRGPLRMPAAQFTDVMVLVLIGAAVIAGFLGEPQDIIAIAAVIQAASADPSTSLGMTTCEMDCFRTDTRPAGDERCDRDAPARLLQVVGARRHHREQRLFPRVRDQQRPIRSIFVPKHADGARA